MVAGTTVHNKCKGSAQGNADQAFIRMKVETKNILGVQLSVASSVFFIKVKVKIEDLQRKRHWKPVQEPKSLWMNYGLAGK